MIISQKQYFEELFNNSHKLLKQKRCKQKKNLVYHIFLDVNIIKNQTTCKG